MSLVIAAFDQERGFLASEGRVSALSDDGAVKVLREDFWKHTSLNSDTAFAAAGAGELVVPALNLARDLSESFAERAEDFSEGLAEFFWRFVKRAPASFPDAPYPLAVVILARERSGLLACYLLASGRDPQCFRVAPGAGPSKVILSPSDETSDYLKRRLDRALPEIFRKTGRSFQRECEGLCRAIIADVARQDARINADVKLAFIPNGGRYDEVC